MAQKKAVPTDDELSAMFAGIGDDDEPESTIASTSAATTQPSTSTKPTPTSSTDNEDDPLAELANLAVAPRAISRPSTPRVGSSAATSVGRRSGDVVHTPPSSESARSSLEKTRNSGEGARVAEQKAPRTPVASTSTTVQPSSPPSVEATTPKSTQATSTPVAAKSGGSWWGGLSAMASAAVKQAEAAVKEIQQNEEAQRWAEQVKGNVGALRGLGTYAVVLDMWHGQLTVHPKAVKSHHGPCQHLQTFFTPLHHQSLSMNACRSTSRMT